MTRGVDVHMRETDAFSWSMEGDARLRMTVVAVAFLDGVPDWDEVVVRLERMTCAAPMFRQRVMLTPGRIAAPKWVVDDGFDLSWHVHRVAAPSPATQETVLGLATRLGTAAFDPARPLWEAWFVDGVASGGAALIVKVHHTLTDGLGGVQLLEHLFDVGGVPLASGAVPEAPPTGATDTTALLTGAVVHDAHRMTATVRGGIVGITRTLAAARHGPRDAVSGAIATWRSVLETISPTGDRLSPVMTQRGLRRRYAALDVPLDELRAACRVIDGTVNDAYLAGITGGLRRYHEMHGATVPELRLTLPVNIRRPGDPTAGNRMALIRYELPLLPADPLPRMTEIRRRTERWKHAPGLAYTEAAYAVVNLLPTGYLQGLAGHVDFVASNVPGFASPLSFAGPRLVALYPFGPTGGTAVNVTMMSYNGTINVGVNVDADAIPDLDAFVTCLRAGFDEVMHAGARTPAAGSSPRARQHRAEQARAEQARAGASGGWEMTQP